MSINNSAFYTRVRSKRIYNCTIIRTGISFKAINFIYFKFFLLQAQVQAVAIQAK
jgi:hypothetical protein